MESQDVQLFPPTGNCLSFLTAPLREMFGIMDRYIDKRTKQGLWSDRPYNLNERATLSVLAGAIWRSSSDNFVFEEFCGDKVACSGAYRGRHDIWFLAEGKHCSGEAKQVWPCVRATSVTPSIHSDAIDNLRQEAEAAVLSKDAGDDFALGIVFSVPDISVRYVDTAAASLRQYQEHLDGCLSSFAKKATHHVVWGRYFRDDLLLKDAFYQSTDKGVLTRPGVDVIIATKIV